MIRLTIYLMLISGSAFGQVRHNFEMSPNETDCHDIRWQSDSLINIATVQNSRFRFTQELKISRYYIPRKVTFYSCDGLTGHVIAKETDKSVLIKDVRKTLWDSLMNTNDPLTFYNRYINP